MRPTIDTKRLVLRQLSNTDAPAISELAGDFDVARMTGSFPHPFPILSAEIKVMILQSMRRQGLAYPYAITIDGGTMMGMVDIFRRGKGFPFELGYWLGRPYWGHGYAVEASTAIMKEAQEKLGMKELVAGVFFDNFGSMRVLEKLGFTRDGEGDAFFSMGRLKKALSVDYHIQLGEPRSCAES